VSGKTAEVPNDPDPANPIVRLEHVFLDDSPRGRGMDHHQFVFGYLGKNAHVVDPGFGTKIDQIAWFGLV
jgi:hypothetical protein